MRLLHSFSQRFTHRCVAVIYGLLAVLSCALLTACAGRDFLGPAGATTTQQEVRDDAGTLREKRIWLDGELVREEHYSEDGRLIAYLNVETKELEPTAQDAAHKAHVDPVDVRDAANPSD